MKIIQVIPFFGLGGAETMCENLIYELKAVGHQILALSLYEKETPITQRLTEAGVELRYLHKKEGLDFSLYGKLRKIFKEEHPDVVHTHLYTTKYVFPVAAAMGIKVVHTVHSIAVQEASSLSRKFNGFFFKRGKAVPVALSENIRQTIVEVYPLTEEQIPVVLNGIDLSKCTPKESYAPADPFRIVHVGSYQEVKNHFGMLGAFAQFHKKYPNTQLHLIGDGPRRGLIEDFAREKGIVDCVVFYGFQSNVYSFLPGMAVFTLPSMYEGIPMSIAEAMGTGLPVVATRVGGIPDMLDDESALLVPVDVDAIAAAYEKYYLDESLRAQHGRAALGRSVRFSAKTMAQDYVRIYQ